MVIHIRDKTTDRYVRELAKARGVSITAAVRDACEQVLDRMLGNSRSLHDRIQPLLDRVDSFPKTGLKADKEFFDGLWDEPSGDFSKTDLSVIDLSRR